MPICPNCESPIEFKSGMVCENCNFDFNGYRFVPWIVLNLKFHSEKRTPGRLAAIGAWTLLPSLIAVALGTWLGFWSLTASVAFFVGVAIPVCVSCLLKPLLAIFKQDNLRQEEH